MLFSYFNFMCISMYSYFRTRFRFFFKKMCPKEKCEHYFIMRENFIFYTDSQVRCRSQYMLNGGNSGQTVLICSLITISLFDTIFAWILQ